MATRQISIRGGFNPDSSGDVWWGPYSIGGAINWNPYVIYFVDGGSKVGGDGSFLVPDDYVGNAQFIIEWTANDTSGDVVWEMDYGSVGGNDTETNTGVINETGINVTDTAPSVTHERLQATISTTSTGFAAGDRVFYTLDLDGADAACTLGTTGIVTDIIFQYTDV